MKTFEEIYSELKSDVESMTGTVLNDGGDMAIRLRAFAYQIFSLTVQQEYVLRQMFPQTAAGEKLEHHAQMRGLSRRGAVKSAGTLRFSISEEAGGDIAVAAGTCCMTAAGTEFVTTEAGSIKAGTLYCDVSAEAKTAGSAGNVPKESVCLMMLAPAGVESCTNPDAFSGGVDEENDESLRARVLSAYRTLPNGANKAYYESAALSCGGVSGVVVLPKKRGRGTVDVIISAEDGMPGDELVSAVEARLEADREICVDINVSAPESVTVNVAAQVAPEEGYTFEDISARVNEAAEAYFNGSLLGEDLLAAAVANMIYSVEGVKNYKLTSPSADVSISEGQLPVLGTLSITEMGAGLDDVELPSTSLGV